MRWPWFTSEAGVGPDDMPCRASAPAHARGSAGSVAVNEKLALAVLRAVVVDLAAVMHDEASRRHRRGALRIEFLAGSHPPRAREHQNVAVVRMKVRSAEGARRKPVAHRI